MQYAGGILLSPVQTLVTTIIFAEGENANEPRHPLPDEGKANEPRHPLPDEGKANEPRHPLFPIKKIQPSLVTRSNFFLQKLTFFPDRRILL